MPTCASHAVAGWLGYLHIDGSPTSGGLRFSGESINIPQGVEVMNDVHVGQRNPGVFRYGLVRPDGGISFPLLTSTHTMVAGSPPTLDTMTKYVLTQAIKPYGESLSYPPTDVPLIGDLLIHRGDINKYIQCAWADSVSISGNAGGDISCDINLRAIYGQFLTRTAPTPFTTIVRSVHFNEMLWGSPSDFNLTAMGGTSVENDTILRPRNFNINIGHNLLDDDSYNPTYPQAIIGFTFGAQTVSCGMEFVGAYLPPNPGSSQIFDNITVGGLYNIGSGIWTTKSLTVPGPSDIAITRLELTGINAGLFNVTPGLYLS